MKEIEKINWPTACSSLDDKGFAHIQSVLSPEECLTLIRMYEEDHRFRSTINMQRYRFGLGEYKYFAYPLPDIIQGLRERLYAHLVPVANGWMRKLGMDLEYPSALEGFLIQCHAKEQRRPTPLILHYEKGGYNTLHQDVYGEIFFPFQVVFMLSSPATDYKGGELVFVEQLPRAQSRAEVVAPSLGDAIIFTTNFRPVKGSKGYYRARMKHGVSPVTTGSRYTMGVIFHDAN